MGGEGEQSNSFCSCLQFAQTGVPSGLVVQEERLIHRPVWPDTSNFLLKVFNVCTYRSEVTGHPSRIYLFFGLRRRCRDCSSAVGPVPNVIFTALKQWTKGLTALTSVTSSPYTLLRPL